LTDFQTPVFENGQAIPHEKVPLFFGQEVFCERDKQPYFKFHREKGMLFFLLIAAKYGVFSWKSGRLGGHTKQSLFWAFVQSSRTYTWPDFFVLCIVR
jgi:hypothetical protein